MATQELTAREQRGLALAAVGKLTRKGKLWLVPSATGNGKKYTVLPDEDCPFCSCPDFEERGEPCKHVFAARFTSKREEAQDGTVTETRTLTLTEKKVYRHPNWPLYSLAQREEKRRFLVLLNDLCKRLPNPPQSGAGRHRTPMAHMVFASCLKVFTGFSSHRFGTDLDDAADAGLVAKLNPVMVCTFLESDLMTPVLKQLVTASALPLAAVETTFAPDSTGFSTSRFVRWFDEKYGHERSGKDWVKAHCIFGTYTHVCTSVEILDRDAADCPQFKALVEATAKAGFNVKEVPADKAYLSDANLEQVAALGGTAYIPFKSNSQPDTQGPIWEKMYRYYQFRREDFEAHYHVRSNAESGFSMVKAKLGDSVRSRTDTAMKNEVFCKLICHNIFCIIRSQVELGIDPVFWGSEPAKAQGGEPPVAMPPAPVTLERPMASKPANLADLCFTIASA